MKKSKKKRILFIIFGVIIVILITVTGILYFKYVQKAYEEKMAKELSEKILNHYNEYVITNKESDIYDNKHNVVGKIGKGVSLTLKERKVEDEYFQIDNLDEDYYIKYLDVNKIDKLEDKDDRYKNYILFNKNIITKDLTNFYDEDGNLVYSFNKSFDLPIIIKDDDRYGVDFDSELLYVKESDVIETKDNNNTNLTNSTGIPVLNYHFVYEDGDTSCNEEICHSASQMKEHFSYIKDNNFFTPKMKELEMYIDGKIQLPQKSVVITFDDGALAENAKKYVDMYEINATLFLITSWFDKETFESDYLEVHSHGHDLHNANSCPGGLGGAIKCLDKKKLQEDLKLTRERLDGSTVFCYPFYEYNDYSIENLKEAGFTMAFGGEYEGNYYKVVPGINKFKLPRWVIVNWTTMNKFISYVNGGE